MNDDAMAEGPRITVLGDINIDAWFLMRSLPNWDDVTQSDRTMLVAGGKGLNMALGAGRLGANIRLLSVIGDDIWGQAVMQQIRELTLRLDVVPQDDSWGASGTHQVSLGNVITTSAPTPVCGVLTNHMVGSPAFLGTKRLTHWNGIQVTPEWKRAIQESDVLLTCLEPPTQIVREAVAIATDAGALVVLNPGPPSRNAVEYQEVSDILGRVDVIIPNDYEARRLLAFDEDPASVSFREIADRLQDSISPNRIGLVCVTRGRSGFNAVYYADAVDASKGHRRRLKGTLGPISTDPVGRGDAFACALAVQLAEAKAVPYSLRFAAAASSVAVRTAGAAAAMPSLDEVSRAMHGRYPEVKEISHDS